MHSTVGITIVITSLSYKSSDIDKSFLSDKIILLKNLFPCSRLFLDKTKRICFTGFSDKIKISSLTGLFWKR